MARGSVHREGRRSLCFYGCVWRSSGGFGDRCFISIDLYSIILVFLDIKIGYYSIPMLFLQVLDAGVLSRGRAQPDSRGRSSRRIRREDLLRLTWDLGPGQTWELSTLK